jgi:hypothetical protein
MTIFADNEINIREKETEKRAPREVSENQEDEQPETSGRRTSPEERTTQAPRPKLGPIICDIFS